MPAAHPVAAQWKVHGPAQRSYPVERVQCRSEATRDRDERSDSRQRRIAHARCGEPDLAGEPVPARKGIVTATGLCEGGGRVRLTRGVVQVGCLALEFLRIPLVCRGVWPRVRRGCLIAAGSGGAFRCVARWHSKRPGDLRERCPYGRVVTRHFVTVLVQSRRVWRCLRGCERRPPAGSHGVTGPLVAIVLSLGSLRAVKMAADRRSDARVPDGRPVSRQLAPHRGPTYLGLAWSGIHLVLPARTANFGLIGAREGSEVGFACYSPSCSARRMAATMSPASSRSRPTPTAVAPAASHCDTSARGIPPVGTTRLAGAMASKERK